VQKLRCEFRTNIKLRHQHSYIYIDETYFDSMDNLEKFAFVPNKGSRKQSHKSWTLICAMSAFGVVYWEIHETQRDGVDASKFQMFLTTLIPLMPDGACLILDNTRWHKAEFVVNLLRLARVEWLWLSPFSPEYNPPIHLFRWLKRRCRASTYDDFPQVIREGLNEVSNENLQSFINEAVKKWCNND
jgi:transposase